MNQITLELHPLLTHVVTGGHLTVDHGYELSALLRSKNHLDHVTTLQAFGAGDIGHEDRCLVFL